MTSSADLVMLRRARRRLAVLSAAAVTGALLLVGVLVLVVESRVEDQAVEAQLAAACAGADAGATNAPAGVWLAVQDARGRLRSSPRTPAGLPDVDSLRQARDGGVQLDSVRADDLHYLVRSERRGAVTVQAAMSVADRDDDRHRLLGSVAIAELVGVAASVAIGLGLARRALRPLSEALDRQRRFVADASHELRTPLTQLHTRAQLLDRDLAGADPGVRGEARRLVADSRRMGEVITDLLTSAELDSRPQRYGPVDVAAVAAEVVDGMRVQAAAAGVPLHLRAAGPAPVRGSAAALGRVCGALVDNALGHTPRGGTVVVEVARSAGRVRLAVSDDGVGLDPADAERIFDRFARGDSGRGRRYGLGLALVREVVTAHGGTISASGEPGRGATFVVLLPPLRDL